MKLKTETQKKCILSAHKHLFEIKEDLCGPAGPLNTVDNQEQVMKILTEAWDKIVNL